MGLKVKLQRISPYAKLPTKGTKDSAYYDLYAAEPKIIAQGTTVIISTGWNIEVPRGFFLDIRPRSGLATKGISLGNTPAVVDTDYRGELKIILVYQNFRSFPEGWFPNYEVKVGDRIAQCALMPVIESDFEEVKELSTTERGTSGLGSTGR